MQGNLWPSVLVVSCQLQHSEIWGYILEPTRRPLHSQEPEYLRAQSFSKKIIAKGFGLLGIRKEGRHSWRDSKSRHHFCRSLGWSRERQKRQKLVVGAEMQLGVDNWKEHLCGYAMGLVTYQRYVKEASTLLAKTCFVILRCWCYWLAEMQKKLRRS